MPRRPLLLALCASPAIAIKCDKCSDRECFEACFYLEKVRSTEAKYKCSSCSSATTTTTMTTTTNEDDGRVAGVDKCFMDGGGCASCCGACTITTDLNNHAKTDSCVCYEASTAPDTSYENPFLGSNGNDCVFIKADGARHIYVQNQCLEGTRTKYSPRRGEEVDTRDALRACGRDLDLISPTS